MKYCCKDMERWSQPCDYHADDPNCLDRLIGQLSKGKVIGIRVIDGGESIVAIANCPWCGTALGTNPTFVGKRMIEVC